MSQDQLKAIEQGWNYLPNLPTDPQAVYEVACFTEDETNYVLRCAWNGDATAAPEFVGQLFEQDGFELAELDLTAYAWRLVPPVTIPPRPIINPEN